MTKKLVTTRELSEQLGIPVWTVLRAVRAALGIKPGSGNRVYLDADQVAVVVRRLGMCWYCGQSLPGKELV